jgi:hypothetical protein
MADKLVFESPRITLQIGGRAGPSPAARAVREPFPVIVGCPRSGTSLLAVMLDAHPKLAIPPETSFLPNVMGLSGDPASLRRRFFDIVTADRMTISNWSDFGLDKEAFWRRLQAIPSFTVAAGTRAFYALYGEGQHKPRTGDKTPGYVFTMQHIQALLPEAHFTNDFVTNFTRTGLQVLIYGGEYSGGVRVNGAVSNVGYANGIPVGAVPSNYF